ncbi:MAG: hypothetical protein OHK93_001159 [Ramalina farinacea]|uniref:Uncharacterized protein n=1 Tax=Ramalina farinacea TaxID=258253 RepID=A0AA43TXE7_9LECA|nr:hypothetical protein [Ramalina farinacea]
MSSNGSMPEGLTRSGHWSRPQLRQATIILPNGKRAHRNVTFREPLGFDGGDDHANERSPLLHDNAVRSTAKDSYRAKVSSLSRSKINESWTFAKSKTGRGILKCSIAYLLGSMATFIPAVSRTLGEQQGKHMVATVTVYFHPARSIGSMFEAMLCAAVAFLYAAFVSFSSMGVSIFFGRTLDLIEVGHAIVLIVFCGAGLGFVGWVKQRVSHPLVNISTSLTSLAIITVLTKEGAVQAAQFSDEKVTQVMLMILMGVAATTAVSLLIDPVSARKELRSDLVKVTDSFSDQLTAITRAFLQGTEAELQEQSYLDAVAQFKKLSGSMVKNLKEAKYEHYLLGTEKEYELEAKTVGCMQRLGQNIGGLRSAATTQFLLLAPPETDRSHSDCGARLLHSQGSSFYDSGNALSPISDASILGPIDEAFDPLSTEPDNINGTEEGETQSAKEISSRLPPLKSQADIFTRFIVRLGPSMVK